MKSDNLLLIIVTITVFLWEESCGYRILAVAPLDVKSHFITFDSLMTGLVKRGHQVDIVSHFLPKKAMKNYTQIINLSESVLNPERLVSIEQILGDIQMYKQSGGVSEIMINRMGNKPCDLMGTKKMQRLIKNPPKNPPYDAIIVSIFTAFCYMGLGYIFNVPVITVQPGVGYPWTVGNYDNLALAPNSFDNDYIRQTSNWQNLRNATIFHVMMDKFYAWIEKYQTEAMRKYLRPDMPDIREVEKNIALTLINSHPITLGFQSSVPTLVQMGGMQIEENDDTLSPELKKWMDESTQGVVYFSLGTMVMIETMPTEQLKEIYDSFRKIAPMRVLMKVMNESILPQGLPENVKTMSWIPQTPVLAHPNTKIFITHCGLGSVEEALYFGVPMIGMPLFADQFYNCEVSVAKGMMVKINFKELSGKVLDTALEKLIHDPTYKEKAVYYSKLFRNQTMSQMDKAVSAIEKVIRNR